MEIKEVKLCDSIARELIALSADWEAENISYGYRKNEYSDLDGERIFVGTETVRSLGICSAGWKSPRTMERLCRTARIISRWMKSM